MKHNVGEFAERYGLAVRRYVTQLRGSDLRPALRLGGEAVALGIRLLAMAQIHERSLGGAEAWNVKSKVNADSKPKPRASSRQTRRSELFFSEAILPMVETRQAAVQCRSELGKLTATLTTRNRELAESRKALKQGLKQRIHAEGALKESGKRYACLVESSRELKMDLRRLTQRVFTEQESERMIVSRKLQNEIAQNLLGISIRLSALKYEARNSTSGFRNEINQTQQLVRRSARSLTMVANSLKRP